MNTTASIRTRLPNLAAIALAALLAVEASAEPSALLPGRQDIAAAGAAVGGHYRSVVPCTSGACAINNKWDNGVLMMGMVEHWRELGGAPTKSYAENWAKANSWRLFSNTNGTDQRNPNWHNRMFAGYAYLRLRQAGSAGATVADVTTNLDAQLALELTPERKGLVDHVFPGQTKSSFSYKAADAEFALPTWIAMGRHLGKSAYYDRARDLHKYQVDVMGLRDPTTKLWYRDETFRTARSPNGEKVMWGRGNGWVAGALAHILTDLPKSRPEYATYRTRFVELMGAARTRQRPDGFWNMNLTDRAHHPAPETSATALLTFAMARGIDLGILDAATFRPVAARAWNAIAASAIADDGHVGFCQGIGLEPVPPGDPAAPSEGLTAENNFCTGAVLLAGAAMHRIAPAAGPTRARTYQTESLATAVSSGDKQADVANPYADGGRANSATLNAKGDFVQFTAPSVPNGTYDLRVKYRLAPNHGIWQLLTDGVKTGAPIDGYDPAAHYAEATLGSVTYVTSGSRKYRFVVTGRNGSSSGYRIGVDSLSLWQIAAGGGSRAALLYPLAGAPGAVAPPAGAVASAAPVPLPPAAGLLLGALGLLGLARARARRRA